VNDPFVRERWRRLLRFTKTRDTAESARPYGRDPLTETFGASGICLWPIHATLSRGYFVIGTLLIRGTSAVIALALAKCFRPIMRLIEVTLQAGDP